MEGTETPYNLFFYWSPEQTVCAAARPPESSTRSTPKTLYSDTACQSYTAFFHHALSSLLTGLSLYGKNRVLKFQHSIFTACCLPKCMYSRKKIKLRASRFWCMQYAFAWITQSKIECNWGAKKSPRHKMMASAPGCHGQSTDLQTRARAPAEGMPVDFPARQRSVRSTDLESCSSGLKSRGPKSIECWNFRTHSIPLLEQKWPDISGHFFYSTSTIQNACRKLRIRSQFRIQSFDIMNFRNTE